MTEIQNFTTKKHFLLYSQRCNLQLQGEKITMLCIFFHYGVKEFHNVVIATIFTKFVPGRGADKGRRAGLRREGGRREGEEL